MAAFKHLFAIVFVALFAVQCQGAEIRQYKSHKKLQSLIENGATISRTLIGSFLSAMDGIRPNVNVFKDELEPEVRKTIDGILTMLRRKFDEEENRLSNFFVALLAAVEKLKPAEVCLVEVRPKFVKFSHAFQTDFLDVVVRTFLKHGNDLDELKTEFLEITTILSKLFDEEVVAFPNCLKPGYEDSKDCLEREFDVTLQELLESVANMNFLFDAAKEVFESFCNDVLTDAVPLVLRFVGEFKEVLDDLGLCVALL